MAVDVAQMLVNLSDSYGPIMKMLTGGAYVIGGAFIFMALYELREYGESRTMMSNNAALKGPLVHLITAAVFIYLPTALDTITMTAFGNTGSPLSYSSAQGDSVIPSDVIYSVLRLVQIVGLVAFIRGWLILSSGSGGGGQPVLGRALTHIIGGILAINIIGTRDVLQATFGVSFG